MQIGVIATGVAIPLTQFKAYLAWHFQLRCTKLFFKLRKNNGEVDADKYYAPNLYVRK